jgi:hypothetical protein
MTQNIEFFQCQLDFFSKELKFYSEDLDFILDHSDCFKNDFYLFCRFRMS